VCVCVCIDYVSSGQCQWDSEELMLIERFFEAKVSTLSLAVSSILSYDQPLA